MIWPMRLMDFSSILYFGTDQIWIDYHNL